MFAKKRKRLLAHTQLLGCNFLPFRIVKERLTLLSIGEPFQARALTPIIHCNSFERLQLLISKEYHRTHVFLRQRAACVFLHGPPGPCSSQARSTTDGDEGDRTPDPVVANHVLSQLSYIPVWELLVIQRSTVRVLGFEPRTSALSELRSSQLSYTRDVQPNPSVPIRPYPNKKANRFGWLLATRGVGEAICWEESGEWSWVFLLGSRRVFRIIRASAYRVNPDPDAVSVLEC
jgi:hypothetical protein